MTNLSRILAAPAVIIFSLSGWAQAWAAYTITKIVPLTCPVTGNTLTCPDGHRITPSVLGVNSTGKRVYVGGFTSPTNQAVLAVINPAKSPTTAITDIVPLTCPMTGNTLTCPDGHRITPSVLGVNSTGKRVYVGGLTSPTNQAVLAVINPVLRTVTKIIPLTCPGGYGSDCPAGDRITPSDPGPGWSLFAGGASLGVDSTTDKVYVGGFTSPTNQAVLAVIDDPDLSTTTAITKIVPLKVPSTFSPAGERITPSVLGVNSTGKRVYVGGLTSPSNQAVLAVIDPAALPPGTEITNIIPLTETLTAERIIPSVLGVNPTTNTVYVGGFASQAVLAVIDPTQSPPTAITRIAPLTSNGEQIDPSVLGVNPESTPPVVYVGGFTGPTNQVGLAVIDPALPPGTEITEIVQLKCPTTLIPLTCPVGDRITPSVLGVDPHKTKPVVYVGGFTSPTNQAVLAVIEK
jgi:hypothetical protein